MYLKKFHVQLRKIVSDFRAYERHRLKLQDISSRLNPHERVVAEIESELVRMQSSVLHLEKRREAFQRQIEIGQPVSTTIDELWRIEDELERFERELSIWKSENKVAFQFYLDTYRNLDSERRKLLPEYKYIKDQLDDYLEFANLFCKVTYSVNNNQETRILVPFTEYGCKTHLEERKFLSTTSRLGGVLIAQPGGKEIQDIELGKVIVHLVELADLNTYQELLDSNMWFESFNFEDELDKKVIKARTYVLDHSYRPYFNESEPSYNHGEGPARHRKGG